MKIDDSVEILEKILDILESDKDVELVTFPGDCEVSYIVSVNGAEYRIIVRKEESY